MFQRTNISFILKIEAARSSETLVFYHSTALHHSKNLKFYKGWVHFTISVLPH
jgi:hypothetical protein